MYKCKNVVATNASAANHGKAATLEVKLEGRHVRLTHSLDHGDKEYGIDISKDEVLPDLVVQLIGLCPRAALPSVLSAAGAMILRD